MLLDPREAQEALEQLALVMGPEKEGRQEREDMSTVYEETAEECL